MNKLLKVKKLHNQYYILRHGQSRVNVLGVISSQPKNGLTKFGLTSVGKKQVGQSVRQAKFLKSDTIIYSSDFLRTRQSAEIAKKILKAKKVSCSPKLRERNFGRLELTSSVNYAKVRKFDRQSRVSHGYGSESVAQVMKRMLEVIFMLEKKYSGRQILLVSHGDPLKILLAAFKSNNNPFTHGAKTIPLASLKKLTLKN